MHNLITDTSNKGLVSVVFRLVTTNFLLLVLCCPLFMSCTTSKNVKSKESTQSSVSKLALDKDAIRVKGLITTAAKSVGDRYQYQLTVQEVLAYGATFATVEPQLKEIVTLIAFSKDLVKGSVVTIDIFTPLNRSSEKLVVNMVSE